MSAVWRVTIVCDGDLFLEPKSVPGTAFCTATLSGAGGQSPTGIRAAARNRGWTRGPVLPGQSGTKRADLCHRCAAELTRRGQLTAATA